LRNHVAAFDDLPIDTSDYESATELFNTCRAKGVQGSHVDFLICAVAILHSVAISTTDRDFSRYASDVPLHLHGLRAG